MKAFIRQFALILAVAMVLSLAACGSKSEDSASTAQPTLPTVAAVEGKATTETDETLIVLDEGATKTITGLNDGGMGHSGTTGYGYLLSYDADTASAVPDNASYEKIDDTHYRFTIKDNAKFFDGTPVTSEDVLYTFKCYADCGSTYVRYIDVENCTIEDDKNFIVALYSYMVGWELDIADSLPIFSKASIEEIGVDNAGIECPISCGKYQFTEFTSGESILAERNPYYWDEEWTGYYKYIRFDPVTDSASRTMAVQSGDANVAHRVSITDYISATSGAYEVAGLPIDCGVCYNLYFNCSEGKLNTPELREAITHAINAEDIAAVLTMGYGTICQGIYGPNFPYYKEYYEGGHPSYDPELAKQMLAEAGATDLKLTMKVAASMQNAATVVQEQLRQIGVTVDVQITEQSVLQTDLLAGDWDMTMWNTSQTAVSNQNFNVVDPSKIGSVGYNVRFQNERIGELVNVALTASEEADRRAAFDEICQIQYDNYVLVGICTSDRYCVISKGLGGVRVATRMGFLDYSDCFMAA